MAGFLMLLEYDFVHVIIINSMNFILLFLWLKPTSHFKDLLIFFSNIFLFCPNNHNQA